MKTRIWHLLAVVLAAGALAGCGPSREEIERSRRERVEAERKAQEEIRKSNEVVNEVSRKLGRKPPPMDLGLPAEKKAEAAPGEKGQP